MFARDIFSYSDPDRDLAARPLTTRDIVPARRRSLSGVAGTLVSRDGRFELAGREAWIFVSIKNRKFNRQYIDWFIRMCAEHGLQGRICRVDDPYRYNRMAELGIYTLADEEVEKIERLSGDIGRMIQKAINGSRTTCVEMVTWRDLADNTPKAYHAELRHAYEARGLVREALSQHVRRMKPIESEKQLNQFVEFFLAEVPVLIHAYYRAGGSLDIYPGPQPEFFWQIELGLFEAELPLLTERTREGRTMLYFDTAEKPGA